MYCVALKSELPNIAQISDVQWCPDISYVEHDLKVKLYTCYRNNINTTINRCALNYIIRKWLELLLHEDRQLSKYV